MDARRVPGLALAVVRGGEVVYMREVDLGSGLLCSVFSQQESREKGPAEIHPTPLFPPLPAALPLDHRQRH